MIDAEVWGRCRQLPEQGGLGEEPQRLAIFTICNKNNTFLGIFRLKFLLKNIFLISSIIQNG